MATTSAKDSRPRENRSREAKSFENQKSGPNRSYRSNVRYEANSKEDKFIPKETKTSNYKYGGMDKDKFRDSKAFMYNKDKDYDKDSKFGEKHRGSESKAKSVSKEKEQQPDKIETIKRLERERKALLKKSMEEERKSDKPNKPMIKHKRTSNIDWTKGYNMGLYGDDDEDYTEYR